jgi:hypothetical protein
MLCCVILAIFQKARAYNTPQFNSAGGLALALYVMASIIAFAYILNCINAYHWVLTQVDGWRHPISPRRAVRFHFIPVYNLYWNFKWPVEIAKFVNWRTQANTASGVFIGTVVLGGFTIWGLLGPLMGLPIVLLAFAYVSKCLRLAFAAAPVPRELHQQRVEQQLETATGS